MIALSWTSKDQGKSFQAQAFSLRPDRVSGRVIWYPCKMPPFPEPVPVWDMDKRTSLDRVERDQALLRFSRRMGVNYLSSCWSGREYTDQDVSDLELLSCTQYEEIFDDPFGMGNVF